MINNAYQLIQTYPGWTDMLQAGHRLVEELDEAREPLLAAVYRRINLAEKKEVERGIALQIPAAMAHYEVEHLKSELTNPCRRRAVFDRADTQWGKKGFESFVYNLTGDKVSVQVRFDVSARNRISPDTMVSVTAQLRDGPYNLINGMTLSAFLCTRFLSLKGDHPHSAAHIVPYLAGQPDHAGGWEWGLQWSGDSNARADLALAALNGFVVISGREVPNALGGVWPEVKVTEAGIRFFAKQIADHASTEESA